MKKSSVVHFEMPYEDAKRVSDFYSKVFGWDMKVMGAEMGNYILAGTTDVDENRMPKNPGAINGGLFPKSDENGKYPMLTIAVENIKESMEEVKKAGGKIQGSPVDIPGVGQYVIYFDTEGNKGSLLQPKM
jgi:hypothetical protein